MIKVLNGRNPRRMVEVAPNRFCPLDVKVEVPAMVICEVVPIPNQPGTFKLVPRSWERLERVTSDLCRMLGLGRQTMTMRRLIRAGFVDGAAISPEVYNVNINSFFNHMKRCAESPDFWQDRKVRDLYRTVH